MMKTKMFLILIIICFGLSACTTITKSPEINIIPKPVITETGEGEFILSSKTVVVYKSDSEMKKLAGDLIETIQKMTGSSSQSSFREPEQSHCIPIIPVLCSMSISLNAKKRGLALLSKKY